MDIPSHLYRRPWTLNVKHERVQGTEKEGSTIIHLVVNPETSAAAALQDLEDFRKMCVLYEIVDVVVVVDFDGHFVHRCLSPIWGLVLRTIVLRFQSL